MIRTQIQLTEQQAQLLKRLSRSNNESIAALIRRALDQFLLTQKPDRRILYRQAKTIAGKFKTSESDIAAEHDRYLEEDFMS